MNAARGKKPDALRVRIYDVLFGDAILVSVPDRGVVRHILIDVGNVQSGSGGSTSVFEAVTEDIERELGGKPIDLYVMTHEHMDHVKGLLYAADRLGVPLRARYAWLTASADPRYGERYPDAVKKRLQAERAFRSARTALAASARSAFEALLLNNDYRETEKCVEHLRGIAKTTSYVHRESDLRGTHPFREAKLEIWAPEADTSDYYGRFTPAAFAFADDEDGERAGPAASVTPAPPPGVDMTAFHALLDFRRRGHGANLFTIDRAANNTSIVFSLDWRGWTLLFAGDAEIRSWKTMEKEGVLRPVHFLKVAHHGSVNGTPADGLLDAIFPPDGDGRTRRVAVSTCEGSYAGVPHGPTLDRLAERVDEVVSVLDLDEDELYVDLVFEDQGGARRRSGRSLTP